MCGEQELALRGSDDSGNVFEEKEVNDGNFRALLRFRVDAGDKELENHLKSGHKNAQYTSPTIQNELIHLCGKFIQEELEKKIYAAKCFSILYDETTDISGTEQLSLCVRYVDTEIKKIPRRFSSFCSSSRSHWPRFVFLNSGKFETIRDKL